MQFGYSHLALPIDLMQKFAIFGLFAIDLTFYSGNRLSVIRARGLYRGWFIRDSLDFQANDDERHPCNHFWNSGRGHFLVSHRLHLSPENRDLFFDSNVGSCANVIQPRLLGIDPDYTG